MVVHKCTLLLSTTASYGILIGKRKFYLWSFFRRKWRKKSKGLKRISSLLPPHAARTLEKLSTKKANNNEYLIHLKYHFAPASFMSLTLNIHISFSIHFFFSLEIVCACSCVYDTVYTLHTDPDWCYNSGAVTVQCRLNSTVCGSEQIHPLSVVSEVVMR